MTTSITHSGAVFKEAVSHLSGMSNSPQPSDEYLIACFLGGDETALREIIDRYDRIVRYTIFRCTKDRCLADPFWLDTVASDTWLGFVRSVRREEAHRPRSMSQFLITIAQRQSVSALRSSVRQKNRGAASNLDAIEDPAAPEGLYPEAVANEFEQLQALRRGVAALAEEDRLLFTQLDAIVSRRWVEAAAELGTSESTLRSKWKRILERLRETLGS